MNTIKAGSHLFPSFTSFWEGFVNRDMANPFWKTGFNMPATNMVEENDQFLIHVAIPGVKGDDFNIQVSEGRLKIELNKKEAHLDRKSKNHYATREFRYSSFKRSFSLPEVVQTDKIHAHYGNSMLKVILPKREECKTSLTRQIPVQ